MPLMAPFNRLAELDMQLENNKLHTYHARIRLSFRIESELVARSG